jgi:hypothetical protein
VVRYPALYPQRQVGEMTIPLTTLDDWAQAEGTNGVSFMKLDTQGSELDILQAGERVLERCLGLEIEVEFRPRYRGQSLLAGVDGFLRRRGFALWRLGHVVHYSERGSRVGQPNDTAYCDSALSTAPAGYERLSCRHALYFGSYRDVARHDDSLRPIPCPNTVWITSHRSGCSKSSRLQIFL